MEKKIIGRGRTADIIDLGENRVLKLFHAGLAGKSAQHEYQIGKLIQETDLPVFKMYEILEVDGSPGIVAEKITGPTLLSAMMKNPFILLRASGVLAALHLRIHNVQLTGLPNQKEYLSRQIERATGLSSQQKQVISVYLERLPSENALCHGDFHPDNIILSSRGPIIIDWPNAASGNPAADVARSCLMLQSGALPPDMAVYKQYIIRSVRKWFQRNYLRSYLRRGTLTAGQVEAWLLPVAAARLAEGIPEESEFLMRTVEQQLRRI